MLKDIKNIFLDLVKNKLDITFANEQEMTALTDAKNINDLVQFAKKTNKLIVVTRGGKRVNSSTKQYRCRM